MRGSLEIRRATGGPIYYKSDRHHHVGFRVPATSTTLCRQAVVFVVFAEQQHTTMTFTLAKAAYFSSDRIIKNVILCVMPRDVF